MDQPHDAANVIIRNTQRKYVIREDEIVRQASAIKTLLGVTDFEVLIWFCSDKKIRELNSEYLQKNKATDVLSFPVLEFTIAGKLPLKDPLAPEKTLGDIIIAPDYVNRQCIRDKKYFEKHGSSDDTEDRGVSAALASTFTLEERLPLLLVHGLCHLMGYDHETESDWLTMVEEEERILNELALHPNTKP